MNIKINMITFVFACFITACSSELKWNNTQKEEFLSGCLSGENSTDYCHCCLEKLQKKYNNPVDLDPAYLYNVVVPGCIDKN
mgnify:CR=1 FL=1